MLYFANFHPAEEDNEGQGDNSPQLDQVSVTKLTTFALDPGPRNQYYLGSTQGAQCPLFSVSPLVMKTAPAPPLCVYSALLILIRVTQLEVIQSIPAL